MILDIDGFATVDEYGQLLIEYKRKKIKMTDGNESEKEEAGRKFTRRVLSATWDYIVSICTKIVANSGSEEMSSNISIILGSKNAKSARHSFKDSVTNNIKTLALLLKISRKVGMQNLSGSIFCLLTKIICSNHKTEKRSKLPKLEAEVILAFESLIENGLELASHSQDCWKHIFKCCQHIYMLENNLFKTDKTSPRVEKATVSKNRSSLDKGKLEIRTQSEEVWLGFIAKPETSQYENVSKILEEGNIDTTNSILTQEVLSKCIPFLTQSIENLFSNASSNLNLMSLLGYLRELCFQSHKELIVLKGGNATKQETFLVSQLSEAILRCIRAGRPMLHLMLSWSIAGPHFMEASSHNDPTVSNLAIQAIHDIIASLLHYNTEMPYFHFNETLFKPYETLILLELCDTDIQDKIVASIHQFVEGSSSEIRSGWRPLFGALRSIKMTKLESTTSSHIRAILDVFEAFLSTDSPVVFTHAALDCIMCLLKHIKSTKDLKGSVQDFEEVVEISHLVCRSSPGFIDAALGYIVRCHSIISKLYLLQACPIFRGAEKIQTGSQPIFVSCVVPGKEVINFDSTTVTHSEFPYSYECLSLVTSDNDGPIMLENSGLLRVWFLLIDGIVSALSACEIEYQASTISTFFTIIESMVPEHYSQFGLFCVNHLLLPGLQTWLRTAGTTHKGWQKSIQGLKQTIGMTTDLILDWLTSSSTSSDTVISKAATLMLKQMVIILIECTVVNCETIARLGCSCLKHLISAGSQKFSPNQWDIVLTGLVRASELTLYPSHQLMSSFMIGSENFYGDIGSVRVAARRDSTVMETNRIRQLCYQMLLLDYQRTEIPQVTGNPDLEDRTYLFLLHPLESNEKTAKEETVTVRVTLSELITGLTAHNAILQIIGQTLLAKCTSLSPNVSTVLSSHTNTQDTTEKGIELESNQIEILMAALHRSLQAAKSLDGRPGLKFLLQKVAQIPHAANLYRQMKVAWSIYAGFLFNSCVKQIREKNLTTVDVKEYLAKPKNDDTRDSERINFQSLHTTLNNLCEDYVGVIIEQTYDSCKIQDRTIQRNTSLTIKPEFLEDLLCKLNGQRSKSEEERRDSCLDLKNCEVLEDDDIRKENMKIHEAECIIAAENSMKPSASTEYVGLHEITENVKPELEVNWLKYVKEDKNESIESDKECGLPEKCDSDLKVRSKGENEEESQGDNEIRPPFQFSDFAKYEVGSEDPKMSESDNSDSEMEKAISSIKSCEEELEQRSKHTSENFTDDNSSGTQNNDEKLPSSKNIQLEIKKENVIDDFKTRKQQHTLPSKCVRKNPFIQKQQTSMSRHPVDPEIEKQRANSLKRDHEAKLKIYKELICLMLNLISELTEDEFKVREALLQTLFLTLVM